MWPWPALRFLSNRQSLLTRTTGASNSLARFLPYICLPLALAPMAPELSVPRICWTSVLLAFVLLLLFPSFLVAQSDTARIPVRDTLSRDSLPVPDTLPADTLPPSVRRSGALPGFRLEQNLPNPFSTGTQINFTVDDPPRCTSGSRVYRVALKIYNVLSQLIASPSTEEKTPMPPLPCGSYSVYWAPTDTGSDSSPAVASGVYLYRLTVEGRSTVKKMQYIKSP